MDLRTELIEFLDGIREYVRESGTNIAYDERESSEFVDIHLQSKLRLDAVSVSDCIANDEAEHFMAIDCIGYCQKCGSMKQYER